MSADSIQVQCGGCRRELAEDPSVPPGLLRPCPSCGSRKRHVSISVSDTLTLHAKLKLKGRKPGLKRPFVEQVAGDDLHRQTGRWMILRRVIDRLHNWYSERVTDPKTGETIHSREEPLSTHRGHGSDRAHP